jgi:iron complex outermembrane receptor protein
MRPDRFSRESAVSEACCRISGDKFLYYNYSLLKNMNKSTEYLIKFRPLSALLIALATSPSLVLAAEAQSIEIVVSAKSEKPKTSPLSSKKVKSSDTAALLSDEAGVSLQTGGGVSSLPVVNGMADERLLICVDCMQITSACANHMNPPLSYIPPSSVGSISVNAGVTPVSMGGDNIGGTVVVESASPVFAENGKKLIQNGSFSSYYRSNNHARGVSITSSVASSKLSFGVTASHDRADDYVDGNGKKVTSTYYASNNLGLTLAAKTDTGVLTVKAGHQSIPGQGFVNQWMDMVDNDASYVNAIYKAGYGWGSLEAKGYYQNTWHKMDSGDDKLPVALRPPVSMPYMPMDTRGISWGYTLKTDMLVGQNSIVRVGNEFHRFTLDDWWPPVAGSMMMSPNAFVNINNGRKDRYALFAEWEAKIGDNVTTILGVRNEQVRMNVGNVQGYNNTATYSTDVAAFNAHDHSRNDSNWDVTAIARYQPSSTESYEFGYARKTRSPNLYERYAWSKSWMCSGMIGWSGDGNGYVGNQNLRPEIAHTFSVTGQWNDKNKSSWQLNVTPYFTYVHDYIDVELAGGKTFSAPGNEVRNILLFTNHKAELYGINLAGSVGVWNTERFGNGKIHGVLGYVHGIDVDNGNSLYHMMPLNMKLSLEQNLSGWTNTIEAQLVARKSETDPLRFEPKTDGYVLVNLSTAYQYRNMHIEVGVTNLLDKFYSLPLGGINYDNFLDSKKTERFDPLAGQGRSFTIGLTQTF